MATSSEIHVAQFGIGPIGLATARYISEKHFLRLVGIVETDQEKWPSASFLNVPVVPTLQDLLQKTRPDVVIHTTGSRFSTIFPQLTEIAKAGLYCVSSSEEMFFPIGSNCRLAQKLDHIAKAKQVVFIGAGVNPGFVMDLLPTFLTSTCQQINHLRIRRIVDVAKRRVQLQRKVGVGLSQSEFRRLQRMGQLGHKGLRESAQFVAEAIGWRLDSISEKVSPVVQRGKIMGIRQSVRGQIQRSKVLFLELEMVVNADNPRDEVLLDGVPPIHLLIPGGIQGDQATAAILVHIIPRLFEMKPGFRSFLDVGIPRFIG